MKYLTNYIFILQVRDSNTNQCRQQKFLTHGASRKSENISNSFAKQLGG